MFELTLWRRIFSIIRKLLEALAEITGLIPEEMIEAMLENKETAKAYAIIIDALAKPQTDDCVKPLHNPTKKKRCEKLEFFNSLP
ncbi:MAG: hypothetical protein LBT43_01615 [Prevotella sp.]|nr:hypothetical protein [Prevotella sp.]